jgi:cell division protein FtsB
MDAMDKAQERYDAIQERAERRKLLESEGGEDEKKKVTKSYKVRPEFKEKLEQLFAASGIKGQDEWLEKVVADWEMRELAKGNQDYTYLLDRLDYHLGGISNIFLTFLHTEKAVKMELQDKHSADTTQLQEEIEQLRKDLKKLMEENKEMSEFVEKVRKEGESKDATIEQLRGLVEKSDLLAKEYLEKNQTLSDLIAKQTKAAEEGERYAEEAKKARAEVERLTIELREMENKIKRLEEEHKQALASALERQELEHEREKVKLQAEYQEKLEAVRSEMSDRLIEALKKGRLED